MGDPTTTGILYNNSGTANCIQARPGTDNVEIVTKVFTTSQEGNIVDSVNFDEPDLLAVNYYKAGSSSSSPTTEKIIFDKDHNLGLKLTLALSSFFLLLYFIYPSILIELISKINII